MKRIAGPQGATFDLDIQRGRNVAAYEVNVYDSLDEIVATVAIYHDGDAEVVWQTSADTYQGRSPGWWADLAAEVAKAVAE